MNRCLLPLALALATPGLAAQTPVLPPGFLAQPIGSGWGQPVGLDFIDARRMVVADRGGTVWYVEDDRRRNRVVNLQSETLSNGDRGLLGIAVHPEFEVNGFLYLLLVVDPGNDHVDDDAHAFSRLVRFRTEYDAAGDLVALPATRTVLLGESWSSGIPSCHLSHAIGSLRFLTDGSLVLASGDGAHYDLVDNGGFDPPCFGPDRLGAADDIGSFRSQSLDSASGKVLRIDPLTGDGLPDNPFYDGDPRSMRSRIWALGLRNPYRFDLLPNSGPREALLVGDVGWNTWEEINLVTGGENLGWPCFEGPFAQGQYQAADAFGLCDVAAVGHTPPLVAWHHGDSSHAGFTGVCTSGVTVYTGDDYPPVWRGRMFFVDFGLSWMRSARLDGNLVPTDVLEFGTGLGSPVELRTHPENGDLVWISLLFSTPKIYRIRYVGNDAPPVAVATATPDEGALPLTVTFSAAGSFDPEGQALSYRWERSDGTVIDEPTWSTTYTEAASERMHLTVTDTNGWSATRDVVVTPGNARPAIEVVHAPLEGAFVPFDAPLVLSAEASDPDQPGSTLDATWTIDWVRAHHEHPAWARLPGLETALERLPKADERGSGQLRLRLEVHDARGASDVRTLTVYDRDALPRVHLAGIDPSRPRRGQTVRATAHVHFPGRTLADRLPVLTFDWGDGTRAVFPDALDGVELEATHVYASAAAYELRVEATLDGHSHAETLVLRVRDVRPDVAVFAPVSIERWVPWTDQLDVVARLRADLPPKDFDVQSFHFGQGPDFARWMEARVDNGVRDVVVLLDYVPAAVFAGEDEGSLAERWLEHGNGLVWSGQTAFQEILHPDGTVTQSGGLSVGADRVLDVATPAICRGSGAQIPQAGANAILPSLGTWFSHAALRYDQIGPAWSVGAVFAEDADRDADALVLEHEAGGFYAQFHCSIEDELPHAAVLAEFLRRTLLGVRRPATPQAR